MKIQAVVFDWAGTVIDWGCHGPVAALEQVFAERGVVLDSPESRYGMGLLKLDQIREILKLPRVRQAWRDVSGAGDPDEADVQALYRRFLAAQVDCIEAHTGVIAGVPEMVEKLRSAGIRIGSTTGYPKVVMDVIVPKAEAQGYLPDCIVTPDDTGGLGRPLPWMIFENLRRLNAYPPGRCIKAGDTPWDVEEGRNAGLITIGVCDSSSEAASSGAGRARELLCASGADHVIGTAPQILEILEES